MTDRLHSLFENSKQHKIDHACGGVPYEYGSVLTTLVAAIQPKQILEVGTALGYTAACMVFGFTQTQVDTIDQDESHLEIAKQNWQKLGVEHQITVHFGKAEGILKTLSGPYDFIFFDAYTPQIKMLLEFERLLVAGGMLVTANLFLKDPKGGKYLESLRDENKWVTGVFADTAVSTKV